MFDKIKELLGVSGFIVFIIGFGVCYINNIVWTFQHWHKLNLFEMALQTVSIFFYPLGGIVGLFHFF